MKNELIKRKKNIGEKTIFSGIFSRMKGKTRKEIRWWDGDDELRFTNAPFSSSIRHLSSFSSPAWLMFYTFSLNFQAISKGLAANARGESAFPVALRFRVTKSNHSDGVACVLPVVKCGECKDPYGMSLCEAWSFLAASVPAPTAVRRRLVTLHDKRTDCSAKRWRVSRRRRRWMPVNERTKWTNEETNGSCARERKQEEEKRKNLCHPIVNVKVCELTIITI